MNSSSVSVAKIAELLDLKNFTDEIDLKKRKITTTDINRPALQLTGYFEHFEESRVEIIGNVEYAYIQQMSDEEKQIRYDAFLKFDIPCVIFSRNLTPDPIFLKEALANHVPVLGTGRSTSEFTAELIYTLGEQLAPCTRIRSHPLHRQKTADGSQSDPSDLNMFSVGTSKSVLHKEETEA